MNHMRTRSKAALRCQRNPGLLCWVSPARWCSYHGGESGEEAPLVLLLLCFVLPEGGAEEQSSGRQTVYIWVLLMSWISVRP